jgi:hypothetical protein
VLIHTVSTCQSPPQLLQRGIWTRLLLPSFSDLLFIFVVIWLFLAGGKDRAGWDGLLLDGDTGWHIRVGESILDTGEVPRHDPFSFSKPNATWYAWEWLADLTYGALYRVWGLKGIVLLGGLQIALFATLLFLYTIWRGASPLVALAVTLLGVGASSIHYLARPHLFTLLLLVMALWLLESDRRSPTAKVWLLIPLTALWTNLHGGFMALLACLGVLVAGSSIETCLEPRRAGRWSRVSRYSVLTAACAAASLLNPYGIELHRHIAAYLRSDWIRNVIQEFQSPSFRGENILQFEALLLLSLLAAAEMLRRRQVTEALWILLWAHLTLGSARHIPVFAAVAGPLVASELARWWKWAVERVSRRSVLGTLDQICQDLSAGFRRTSLWLPAMVLFLAAVDSPMRWPTDFPGVKFPLGMIARHSDQFPRSRVFTQDQWADYLIYRFYPRQKVFFDGRSDFYGPAVGNQYIALMNGKYNWEEILDRHSFDLVLTPPEWPLASLLKQNRRWRVVEDDGQAVLFSRVSKKVAPGLMKQTGPSESTRGDYSE